jgi:thiol-disulfide isomerase/thioredoxin
MILFYLKSNNSDSLINNNPMNKYSYTINKTLILLALLINFITNIYGQSISGNLKLLSSQEIKLEGFNGFDTYTISSNRLDSDGNFALSYSMSDYGIGYLVSADNKPFLVVLSGEDIELKGEALSLPETIKFSKGIENILFEKYANEHPKREQALSAWNYLEKFYTLDPLFSSQEKPRESIQLEKNRILNEDINYLSNLPSDSYVRWFLPIRKTVSSVSVVAQSRPEQIPYTIDIFRSLDHTDPKLFKSGLLRDVLESHFWLLENSGNGLDSIFKEMKISINHLIDNLIQDEAKLNVVMDYLFDLLERQSLFEASEYLAIKLLNEENCNLDNNFARQLETYRAMKIGNTAPDFEFSGDIISPSQYQDLTHSKLSDLKTKYTLIVFAASWCPKCSEEVPVIASLYSKWKKQEIEVVVISLDSEKKEFDRFFVDFPFISMCDYKKWDGQIANDYYIFSTPTMFLLDKNREILLRPNSVKQMDAWVDWYATGKN